MDSDVGDRDLLSRLAGPLQAIKTQGSKEHQCMEVAGLAIQDGRLGGEDFAKPVEPHSIVALSLNPHIPLQS